MDNNDNDEELKKRLSRVEFNNYEEDLEVNKEENEKAIYEVKDKKKNVVIIILIACVIVLLLIILFFLILGNKKNDNSNSNESNSNSNTENKNDDNSNSNENDAVKVIDEINYDYSKGNIFFNKYIYVPSKDNKKIAVTDLDGNVILDVDSSFDIFSGLDNSLYAVNLSNKSNENITVKKIKDNKSSNIFSGSVSGALISNENGNILGVYKEDKNNDDLYIFNSTSYDTIKLDSYGAYSDSSSKKESKMIYNGKYYITYNSKNDSYGVYDIKEKKQLISNSYENIKYLHDDVFSVVKNGDSGVINKDNKILLKIDNDVVDYNNGLYFAQYNGKIHVLDANFNDLNSKIEISSSKKFDLISFKDNVVIKIGTNTNELSEYIAVDKKGNTISLGKGNIAFVGGYLVVSTEDDTFINMYDSSLTSKHKINVGEKAIKLDSCYDFLGNILVINRKNLYNLSNDTSKGTTSWYRRTSQEFEVRIDFKGEYGTVTILHNGEELKKLENVSVDEFLKAKNNGITIVKNYFIYNAGGIIVLKRPETDISSMLDFMKGVVLTD